MYINRTLTAKLERLFSVLPVVVITGVRQVGKSTLLAHTLGKGKFSCRKRTGYLTRATQ